MRYFLLTSLLAVSFFASAEKGYYFPLSSKNEVDQEIVVSKVVSFYQYLGGVINIEWHRNDADETAKSIRQKLIESGVTPIDVRLRKQTQHVVDGFPPLIAVRIDMTGIPMHCDYHQHFYRFRNDDHTGCAVESNAMLSLLNRKQVDF
jgi:hypothetical protein